MRRELPHAAWITIQIGCDNACAFCIVPAVRGPEVSRPFGQIVEEVRRLAVGGTVEVTLLGQNVNSYGRDITAALRTDQEWRQARDRAGSTWTGADRPRIRPLFADLLEAVAAVDGIRRVRFTSPHPKDLRPETIDAMAASPAVCEHLHLPLQSGSDRTLAAMHRGYTAERYLSRVAAARAAIPDLAVTTDLIVGFPGETDADFERTLEVVAEVGYDSAYTFVFSPRAGHGSGGPHRAVRSRRRWSPTASTGSRWSWSAPPCADTRPGSTASRRSSSKARASGTRRSPAAGPGRTSSSTSPTPLPVGTFADVRITRAAPHFLVGELVAVTARPRHRRSIPVVAV